ncbi:hypothetical protein DFH08DRAFT_828244 [Mycena albidolilacea]|uniref:Uncharacterized protein n=1 Tax=Mycena albidolilacea TaxID=1033008 RepID=A0AAD6YX44_9AGAR|nr:hypothetical protein DFH08DRAFT_828244 [Mycena albidolilacea]
MSCLILVSQGASGWGWNARATGTGVCICMDSAGTKLLRGWPGPLLTGATGAEDTSGGAVIVDKVGIVEMDTFGELPKGDVGDTGRLYPETPAIGLEILQANAIAGRIRVIVDANIFITVGGGEVAVVEFRNGRVIGSVEGVIVGVTVSHTQRKTGWNTRRSAGNGCEKIKVVLSRVRTAVKGYRKYSTMFSELQYSKQRWRSLQRLQERQGDVLGCLRVNSFG